MRHCGSSDTNATTPCMPFRNGSKLREVAADIKRHTLANLAEYLEQFEREATRRGIKVHWASTADDHNRIVL